jgi:hypothetical protein
MIDEVAGRYFGIRAEIRIVRRPGRLNHLPRQKAIFPAMLQHAAAIVGGRRRALHADGAVATCRIRLKLGVDRRVRERGFTDVVVMGGVVVSRCVGCRAEHERGEHGEMSDGNLFHGDLLFR